MGKVCSVQKLKEQTGNLQSKIGYNSLVVPGLEAKKFTSEYQVGRPIASKVVEVKNRITKSVDVAYRLPKLSFPCRSGETIGKALAQIMEIDHPNICRLLEGFDEPGCIHLIYQKAPPLTLHESVARAGHISEQRAAEVAWQLVRALKVSASARVPLIHGALGPKNVLVNPSGAVMVTDLGLIDLVKPDPLQKVSRDMMPFIAPEVLEEWLAKQTREDASGKKLVELSPKERKRKKNSACDVWSLGVITFQLLCGAVPFHGQSLIQLASKIVAADAAAAINKRLQKISATAQELVGRLLAKGPEDRPTLDALMEHAWLSEKHRKEVSSKPLDPEIVKQLVTVQAETHFKKFVMRMVASQMPPSQIRNLEQVFAQMDLNGDGLLSLAELKQVVSRHPELAEHAGQLEEAWAELDEDNSGTISVSEFVAATLDNQEGMVQTALWDTFKAIDTNHDGKLNKKELRRVVKELAGRISCAHVDELTRLIEMEVDEDMTFEDFTRFMQEEGRRAARAGCCSGLVRTCKRVRIAA